MSTLRLNRKSPLPIHLQLKAQLVYLIQVGRWTPGMQLPTVRQLAGSLRINRNTVSRVFAELARDGHLSCERGRGTFVSRRRAGDGGQKARELLLVVDEAIGGARRLGFSPADCGLALYARAHAAAGAARLRNVPLLFLECDRPELRRFSGELTGALPFRVEARLIKDVRRMVLRTPQVLGKYGLAVTMFSHLREVKKLLSRTTLDVVGLPAEVRLETLTRLAAFPQGTRVGVVCRDSRGTENVKLSVRSSGLTHLRLVRARGQSGLSLRRMLRTASVVVCSSLMARKIKTLAPRGTEILVDDRRLGRAGIEMLRRKLATLETGSRPTP